VLHVAFGLDLLLVLSSCWLWWCCVWLATVINKVR